LLFQTLDDKKECVGVYADKQLHFQEIPENLTATWSYSPYLKGLEIDYANLYCEGKTLDEVCPEHLSGEWQQTKNKLKAFITSFIEAKVSLEENCFFDLTPKKFLEQYCETKNKITAHILQTHAKPQEYDFYRRFNELITDIKYRPLNIDLEALKNNILTEKDLTYYHKLRDVNKYINYNMFGTLTGRLSINKGSFPIQNFQKDYRFSLKPHNDWFVAFDINAAELRTSLALLNAEQPEKDLYDWIGKEILENVSRAEAKKIVIEWLYNSNNPMYQKYSKNLDSVFKKDALKSMYWVNGEVHTPFGRKIASDEHHVISYLNQSTFIDLFHRQVLKVDDFLKDKKSFISFLLHDEFVLDLCDDEKEEITEIIKIIENTKFGKFLSNVKVGRNYGSMKKLNLKVI
jgi:hypothetical protein